MPLSRKLGHGHLVRPMLELSRLELSDYAKRQGLAWADDPSNRDDHHARNYLRRHVLPAVVERWPEAATNASRSARLCAEATSLLGEMARQDAVQAGLDATLDVSVLRAFSESRVRNVLRTWIADQGHVVPGFATMHEICAQVLQANRKAAPAFGWEGTELRLYRDQVYLMAPLAEPPGGSFNWPTSHPLTLPGGLGELALTSAGGETPALATKLLRDPLIVRFRTGGESFKPAGCKTRKIKKWLQDKGVPPWQRERWPLVCLGNDIAWVPGLGPAAQFAAKTNEAASVVRWQRPARGTPALRH